MDRLKERCCKIFYDYRASLINYEEFKGRLKVIDDEIKTKQTSLKLNTSVNLLSIDHIGDETHDGERN